MEIFKEKCLFSLTIVVLALGSVACNSGVKESSQEHLIGVLIVDGSINDESFNEGAWKGIERAKKELSYEIFYRENKQASEYPSAFSSVLELHPNLVFGIGYKLEDETRRQAVENPNTLFASIDGVKSEEVPKNLVVASFSVEQASFLAGFVAANVTQTGKIGFLGGVEGEIIGLFDYGFEAGARYARPDIQIINRYAQSFFDVSKGRSIADLMIQNGVDVIFHASGPTGGGMIEMVREKQLENDKAGITSRLWAIGVDQDQYSLAPEIMLTSVVKRVDNVVYGILEEVKKGNFKGGQILTLGLEGNYVGLSETSSIHLSANLLAAVEGLKGQIAEGNIQVPRTKVELETFKIKLQHSTL